MAGAGKSTIGKSLAKALGFDFIDLDDYISAKGSRTLQQIVEDEGEQTLLELEKQSMYEVDLTGKVVAPGGSIIYHSELMEHLRRQVTVVYLDDSFENIKQRLTDASSRAIVGLRNKSLRQIYDERRPLYSKYADITLSCQGKSPGRIVREILDSYSKLGK